MEGSGWQTKYMDRAQLQYSTKLVLLAHKRWSHSLLKDRHDVLLEPREVRRKLLVREGRVVESLSQLRAKLPVRSPANATQVRQFPDPDADVQDRHSNQPKPFRDERMRGR